MTSPKKQFIYQIIEGTEPGSPVLDRSALGELAKLEVRELKSSFRTWGIEFPLIIAVCSLSLAVLHPLNNFELTVWLSCSFIAFISLFWLDGRRRALLKRASEPVEAGLEELRSLRDYIRSYLADMNHRTTRYFHCVTNSKVSSFFILSQMQEAIHNRVTELEGAGQRLNAHNCMKLHKSLQGSITFSDGAVAGAGNTHIVPLSRLNGVIGQLIQYLEAGIEELEQEIGYQGSHPEAE